MHAFWVICFSFSAIFAFGFLFAGWTTLLQFDDREEAEVHRELAEARKRSWIHRELKALRFIRREAFTRERLAEHWRTRRDTRRLICLGAVFLTLAVITGYFTGVFH
jgi:hypothetical protein